jgi:HEAT repeat protein
MERETSRRVQSEPEQGSAAVAAVPAIERALGDPDSRMRFRAAFMLHRIGASTESAVAILKEAAMAPDEEVRNRALEALKQLGREG